MKIVDIKSKKVYYDTEGAEYYVTAEFWKALKAGKIQYRSGGEANGILFTEVLVLKIDDNNFEKVFNEISLSTGGKAAMEGKVLVTTIL